MGGSEKCMCYDKCNMSPCSGTQLKHWLVGNKSKSNLIYTLFFIQFEKLDFGEANVLDTMYNADVALIDLSIDVQRNALFYHIGCREGFGMTKNILVYNDHDSEITMPLKVTVLLKISRYPIYKKWDLFK